jgi:hypothetical protein
MTNQQRLVVAIVFVVAVVGGGALAWVLTGGGGPGASPSPAAVASELPSASPAASGSAEASPTGSAEVSPSVAPSEEPSPTGEPTAAPTATPRPTPGPGRPTTVVVTGFQLDAADDPAGVDRRLSFRSQGTGDIRVDVRVLSPMGTAAMCLYAAGEELGCTTDGSLEARTTRRREDFQVALRGQGIETPEVEVTITFPARNPSLGIEDARFDGTSYPQTNGIRVLVTAREDGEVTLVAGWGGHPFAYEVDLLQVDGPGSHVLANQGPSTGVDVALPVSAGTWTLVLQNIDEGFGVTPLDAVIGWP